ncbi:hypothetical protein SARC_10402 [Sphaeroforma arctica JP610]|uniref:Phosphate transporter n=2 Tax=Sphaeroforma arctica JP610 TaxID=667725 RepID=A0A0L0FK32_9EUKA|nr:hypothetical protein SARC_10402 [Sphaeroforma arctica JP610]KNC77129.1 hypothetical protein SARC_10402 [Sphaeroforma arctica JP610]|eukprot:XP_014151031.1 hypothetical protein SARC_10402 [Sphaeroforma arctica JP610]
MDFIQVIDDAVVNVLPEHSFTWIFVLSLIFAFAAAFGIGANDVANSFATAIASRTLTLLTACIIAAIAEFGGAVLLGNSTSDTIRQGIVDVDLYASRPDLLLLTMFAALVGMSVWLIAATLLGMPVSTTHSIIGAVIGAGIACFGVDAVQWGWDGVGKILASFVISPAIAGSFAAIVFMITKYTILIWPNSTKRAIYSTPIYAMGTMGLVMSFWVYKGSPSLNLDEKSIGVQLAIILGSVGFTGLISLVVVVPWLLKITKQMDQEERTESKDNSNRAEATLNGSNTGDAAPVDLPPTAAVNSRTNMNASGDQPPPFTVAELTDGEKEEKTAGANKIAIAQRTLNVDVDALTDGLSTKDGRATHQPNEYDLWLVKHTHRREYYHGLDGWKAKCKWIFSTREGMWFGLDSTVLWGVRQDVCHDSDEDIQALHESAFQYRPSTEVTFKWLQVMSSSFMSFSHGANDVANAIAPLATVFALWSSGASGLDGTTSKQEVPIWILVFGGVAIDIGLFLLGWKIVYALGNNITFHSPSRGFSMEMGAVITVLMATFLGIPVSTTHCITGATVAVGLCNGDAKSIHWMQVLRVLSGWILTLPAAGLVSYVVFAIMANAPNREYVGVYVPANSTVVTF